MMISTANAFMVSLFFILRVRFHLSIEQNQHSSLFEYVCFFFLAFPSAIYVQCVRADRMSNQIKWKAEHNWIHLQTFVKRVANISYHNLINVSLDVVAVFISFHFWCCCSVAVIIFLHRRFFLFFLFLFLFRGEHQVGTYDIHFVHVHYEMPMENYAGSGILCTMNDNLQHLSQITFTSSADAWPRISYSISMSRIRRSTWHTAHSK